MAKGWSRERDWLGSVSFLKEWQWAEATGKQAVTIQGRVDATGSWVGILLPILSASSQTGNYMVWAQMA